MMKPEHCHSSKVRALYVVMGRAAGNLCSFGRFKLPVQLRQQTKAPGSLTAMTEGEKYRELSEGLGFNEDR